MSGDSGSNDDGTVCDAPGVIPVACSWKGEFGDHVSHGSGMERDGCVFHVNGQYSCASNTAVVDAPMATGCDQTCCSSDKVVSGSGDELDTGVAIAVYCE